MQGNSLVGTLVILDQCQIYNSGFNFTEQPMHEYIKTFYCFVRHPVNANFRIIYFEYLYTVQFNNHINFTLSREYSVVRDRFSRLLFTSEEDRFCATLRVQEQSTNMTSQCQYPTFACRHRSTAVTSQY